ncbi:11355_t:CDS:1 [Ambispora gerdemannii]|uniref:11355_t:CDS:1 n=1 Tax=Ambispora gerdemannii TaxID=144530 RepID=A0A9N9BTT7_9GLOM|nr:11355_t:CDS:1 [Ambispora gerdemannii]
MSMYENESNNLVVVNDERSNKPQQTSIDLDSKNNFLLTTTTNNITNIGHNNDDNKKCKKITINELPNELLSMIIHNLSSNSTSNDNSARHLWLLRRVSHRFKYIIHQVVYEKVKYRLAHSAPTTLQLFLCQITGCAITYSDPIRVHVTGYNKETGEVMLGCQRSRHFLRVNKKTKLFLAVRKKTPVIMTKNKYNGKNGINNGGDKYAEPTNSEILTFRNEECKEPLRDGKHAIHKANSFKVEYELVRNCNGNAREFFEKSLLVLSVIVTPILILETAISK